VLFSLGADRPAGAESRATEEPGIIAAAQAQTLKNELSGLMGAVAGAKSHPRARLGATVTATRDISPELRVGIQARLAEAKDYLERGNREQFADSLAQAFILLYYPHEGARFQGRIWKANRDRIEADGENGLALLRHLRQALSRGERGGA
jgi:hypothetical protein